MPFCVDTSAPLKSDHGESGRSQVPALLPRARAVLDSLTIVTVSVEVFEGAGSPAPEDLRSLDAIHLAAALDLGDDLDGLVTYDERLARAAAWNGVVVVTP